jgi:hypothetical protein
VVRSASPRHVQENSGPRRLNVSTPQTRALCEWLEGARLSHRLGQNTFGRRGDPTHDDLGPCRMLAETPLVAVGDGVRPAQVYPAGMSYAPCHPELLRQSVRAQTAVVRLLVAAHCHRHLHDGVTEDAAHSG